jgi:hypothetical protein
MKKAFFIFLLGLFFCFSCGGSENKPQDTNVNDTAETAVPEDTAGQDLSANDTISDTAQDVIDMWQVDLTDLALTDNKGDNLLQDIPEPECKPKFSTPVDGVLYNCTQICEWEKKCGGSGEGCSEICGSILVHSKKETINFLGDCFKNTSCSDLPAEEKTDLGGYCMEKYINENAGNVTSEQMEVIGKFSTKKSSCKFEGGDETAMIMVLLARAEIWEGFKACMDIDDCTEFGKCIEEWTCFFDFGGEEQVEESKIEFAEKPEYVVEIKTDANEIIPYDVKDVLYEIPDVYYDAPDVYYDVMDIWPDSIPDVMSDEDIIQKECVLKYTTPVSGAVYDCNQICDKFSVCKGETDTGCPQACNQLIPNANKDFINTFGACVINTQCSELPEDPDKPGNKMEMAEYCIQQYFTEKMPLVPSDVTQACTTYVNKITGCAGGSDPQGCYLIYIIARDEMWNGFKGCFSLPNCIDFGNCIWEWSCFFPK